MVCPPRAKNETLNKKWKTKKDAITKKEIALKECDIDQALKYANRSTYVTNKMLEDAKTLIKLLGIPYIDVIKILFYIL